MLLAGQVHRTYPAEMEEGAVAAREAPSRVTAFLCWRVLTSKGMARNVTPQTHPRRW